MASTVTPATLTVTLTEAITLNGAAANTSNVLSIASVGQITRKIVTVGTTAYDPLVEFGARSTGSAYLRTGTKYIRITNLDNANSVAIRLKNTAGSPKYGAIRLAAGQSFILSPDYQLSTDSGTTMSGFDAISDIEAIAIAADVDVELYVAGA
tara:strand:- start:16529 stop:16987 length:459 start_codon:yes stop_codon:yes gene_type:complete